MITTPYKILEMLKDNSQTRKCKEAPDSLPNESKALFDGKQKGKGLKTIAGLAGAGSCSSRTKKWQNGNAHPIVTGNAHFS